MTQFGAFALGIFAFFLFLIISVSANQKEILPEIMTKMSFYEYCNSPPLKKTFCSSANIDVVVIVVTTSEIDERCAGKLIEKAKNEYGIKEIIGGFNFEIVSYSHEAIVRTFNHLGFQTSLEKEYPAIYNTCSADIAYYI